jgi:tetratricopeptide (TPR) repeat protein
MEVKRGLPMRRRNDRLPLIAGLTWLALGWPTAPHATAQAIEGQETRALRREPHIDGLGKHTRRVTTSSGDAQRYFDQGLNLLFAFNHDEACRSFRQAAELDPSCAMAWWGVAVAQGPHINRIVVEAQPARVAVEAIEKARATASSASAVERGLIEALALRCVLDPPEDRSGLDRAYAEAMEALWREHPEDADVGALCAEARMNLRPWDLYTQDGQPQPGTEAIVALLEAVLTLNADHPLANHLYIHAVEASRHPERAEAAADRLRNLQPGLSHNVHMPSHIDVRLGHWLKAEQANRNALIADRRFLAIRPDPGFFGIYIAHNYHMLGYAAMMRGVSKVAIEAFDTMMTRMPEEWARAHAALVDGYIVMPLEVRMRFGRWDEILAAPEPDAIFPLARTLRHYARAVAFAAQGRADEARREQDHFHRSRGSVPETSTFGNNKAGDLLAIAEHLMTGEILYREGHATEAFAELREAARRQDLLRYSEPPDWILPVRHALGAALMQSRRFEEAEQVYRDDLDRLPENGWSLFGLARSLELQGKTEEAGRVRARWEEVWKDADVRLRSSCFCQPGV